MKGEVGGFCHFALPLNSGFSKIPRVSTEGVAALKNDLIQPDGRYDRGAIMRDAHRQFLVMGRHGWNFSRCLSYSWARAHAQRERAAWSVVVNAAQAALAMRAHPLTF